MNFVLHVQNEAQWKLFSTLLDTELQNLVKDAKTVAPASLGAYFLGNVRLTEIDDIKAIAERLGKWILAARGSSFARALGSAFANDVELAHTVRWAATSVSSTSDIQSFGSLLCCLLGVNVSYVKHEDQNLKQVAAQTRTLEITTTGAIGRTPLPMYKSSNFFRASGSTPEKAYLGWHAHRAALALLRPYLAAACANPNFEDALHRAFNANYTFGGRPDDVKAALVGLIDTVPYSGALLSAGWMLWRKSDTEFRSVSCPNALFAKKGTSGNVPSGALNAATLAEYDEDLTKRAEGADFFDRIYDLEVWRVSDPAMTVSLEDGINGWADIDAAYELLARRIAASAFLGQSCRYEEWQAHLVDTERVSVGEALADASIGPFSDPEAHHIVLSGTCWMAPPRYGSARFESRGYSLYVGTTGCTPNTADPDDETAKLWRSKNPLTKDGNFVTIVFGQKKIKVTYHPVDAKTAMTAEKLTGPTLECIQSIFGADAIAERDDFVTAGVQLHILQSEVQK